MNDIEQLIEMFLAAGYDDSKAGISAFENFSPIKFFEAYRAAQWVSAESAPIGKRVLVRVPIEHHRLVIGLLTKDGLWLDERMQPMPFVPTEWMSLPS